MNRDIRVALKWSLHGLNMLTTSLQPVLAETARNRDYEKLQELLDYMKQLQILEHNLSDGWREQLDELPGESHFTHIRCYYMPILAALYEMGGSAHIYDVLRQVELRMKPMLTPVDYEILGDGVGRSRWSTYARWARFNLMKEGYIEKTRQEGLWELSAKGKSAVIEGKLVEL